MCSAGRNVLGKCNNIFLLETTYKSKLLLNYTQYRSSSLSIFRSCLLTRCLSSCHNLFSQIRFQSSRSNYLKSNKNTSDFLKHRCDSWQVTRKYAEQKASSTSGESAKKEIVEAKESPYAHLTMAEKVKEAGKDATYTGVIIIGVGVTAVMFFAIGRELFSSQSPSGLYGKALKMCEKNDQLKSMLGEPMKGYGETTRRGRRRYVSHQEYIENGVKYMRIRFYIEGPYAKGTVNLEVKQNESGKYEYRYIVVDLDGYPRRSVLVVDNT
ncbi:mitochondrial import inner membrane translocase subunit Tim21-like [Gigantopelta aegis]|uniref:mitochondrial import inner membrane translocase subunit Tim21-like n=1 Tax=Gigantopelta aegis TaxID=1735272 RepID=UPI001B88A066|nr:mitochondrial import inner membrane translocase subunit Tim21-like [Gigantopelta aegis]